MDTRPTSRRRPLQTVVDLPELRLKRLPLFEIVLGELHQVVQSGALVVAAHRLVQRPPHQLHRVALRRPRRQRMQIDAAPRVLHILLHPFAQVAAVVVHREVQLPVAAVGSAQMVEQLDEKLAVPALPGHPVQAPRLEVQRPRNPRLAVGPRSAEVLLFTFSHPAEAHLGVGLQLGLVLEKRSRFLGHLQDVLEPRPLLFDLLLGAFLGRDGARPSPAEAQTMERAADGLPANRGGPLPEKLQGEQLAAPARAQPAMRQVGESSSSSCSKRSFASFPSKGLGPRLRRSSKAALPSRRKRDTTVYTVVREQKRAREISVGERPPEEASSTMCILSLRLGFTSRFISMMRPLRSSGAMVILSMGGRLFRGWMDLASLPCHKGRSLVQL